MLIVVVFVAVALREKIDIGLIGFTIIYTLSLAGLLQWTVRQVRRVKNIDLLNETTVRIETNRSKLRGKINMQ